ncbi:hypothetical protein GCM10029992_13840 [Glycomyces albus]
MQAADEADDLAAPAEALLHLERALRIYARVSESERPQDASELRLTMAAASEAEACGEFKRALSYSSAAVALADKTGDTVQSAAYRRKYAKHLMVMEGYEDEAHRVALEAWELVKDDRPHPTKAWVQAILARLTVNRPELGTEWARLAIETADAIEGSGAHTAAKADALVTLGAAELRQGGPIEECPDSPRKRWDWSGAPGGTRSNCEPTSTPGSGSWSTRASPRRWSVSTPAWPGPWRPATNGAPSGPRPPCGRSSATTCSGTGTRLRPPERWPPASCPAWS